MSEDQPSLFDKAEVIDLSTRRINYPRQNGKTHQMRIIMAALTEPGLYYITSKDLFIRVTHGNMGTITWFERKDDKWLAALRVRETGPAGIYNFWQLGVSEGVQAVYDAIEDVFPYQMQRRVEYSTKTKRCTECNRELTNERSVWYSIGPDCEKKRPEIIAQIDALHGGVPWEEANGIHNSDSEGLETREPDS